MDVPIGRARLRIALVGATGLETAAWLYLTAGGLSDTLPFAKGYGDFAALLSTIVFVTFALPALLLAAFNRGLLVASWLASIAALLYLYDPLLRITAAIGAVPFVGLFVLGVGGALVAAVYQAARNSEGLRRQH